MDDTTQTNETTTDTTEPFTVQAKNWATTHKTGITATLLTLGALAAVAITAGITYRNGHADGYADGYTTGFDAGLGEGVKGCVQLADETPDKPFREVVSNVTGFARRLPEGCSRSAAKTVELERLGISLPDDQTFVDAHTRTRTYAA